VADARLAPRPASGLALARVPDGRDTDDGHADFVAQAPTPGAPNDGGPSACVAGEPGDVLLDELMIDPDGADAGAEWVELLSTSSGALDASGWRVERASSPSAWTTVFELPARTSLAPGGRLALAGAAAVVPDGALVLDALAELGNATTGSDAVRLVDCRGAVVDLVAYGAANTPGEVFADEPGTPIGDDRLAPRPERGASLARLPDGADTDDGAADFGLGRPPTPGAPNTAPACTPSTGGVVVNELLPDAPGADAAAGTELVELFSSADAVVDLAGWSIVALGTPGAERLRVRLPDGAAIAPGGFLVVGGAAVEVADVVVEGLDLASGAGGDVVLLEDCAGARVDGVLYGGANTDALAEDDGSVPGEGARDPREGQCVARAADGVDHDASAEDFVVTSLCTPGTTNATDGPPVDDTGAGGCGADGPRTAPPTHGPHVAGGSCATSPWPRLPAGLLALLVTVTRRRRGRAGRGGPARSRLGVPRRKDRAHDPVRPGARPRPGVRARRHRGAGFEAVLPVVGARARRRLDREVPRLGRPAPLAGPRPPPQGGGACRRAPRHHRQHGARQLPREGPAQGAEEGGREEEAADGRVGRPLGRGAHARDEPDRLRLRRRRLHRLAEK
jgi:hypothetical protein